MTEPNLTKRCTKCVEEKPLAEFYTHPTGADGYASACKMCKRRYRAKHFQKNREQILSWFRNYQRPASYKETLKHWYKNNRDRTNARHRKWNQLNPEKSKKASKNWAKAHPEQVLIRARKYRSLKRGAIGSHTKNQIDDLYKKQRGRCADCSKKLKKYHADHIVPLSKGGSNSIYNIQLLCPQCNFKKSDKDPAVNAQRLGKLI